MEQRYSIYTYIHTHTHIIITIAYTNWEAFAYNCPGGNWYTKRNSTAVQLLQVPSLNKTRDTSPFALRRSVSHRTPSL